MTDASQDISLWIGDPGARLQAGDTLQVVAFKERLNPFDFPETEEIRAEVHELAGEIAAGLELDGYRVQPIDISFEVIDDWIAPDVQATVTYQLQGFGEIVHEQRPDVLEAGLPVGILLFAIGAIIAGGAWTVVHYIEGRQRLELADRGLSGVAVSLGHDLSDAAVPVALALVVLYLLRR